ncbi:hypothetical protein ACOSP7_004462 [Xanthoceras sorbifolium]
MKLPTVSVKDLPPPLPQATEEPYTNLKHQKKQSTNTEPINQHHAQAADGSGRRLLTLNPRPGAQGCPTEADRGRQKEADRGRHRIHRSGTRQ